MEKLRTNAVKKIREIAASAIGGEITHSDWSGLNPGKRTVSACEATSLINEWFDTPRGGANGKCAFITTRSNGARLMVLAFNINRDLTFTLPA